MKIKLTICLLALALGTTSLFAAPLASVLVSSNSLSVPVTSTLSSKTKVTFGGNAATWHQTGLNVIVDLPPNLAGGMYTLVIPGHPAYAVSIGTQGPAGPAGAQGPQGDQGIQGSQGEQGSQGPQGAQGAQGSQGAAGAQGEQGPQGLVGANGVDGINGTNGLNGVDGVNGTNGLNGLAGANGVDGVNGTNGLNGVDGINGTNGLNGLNGVNGIDGLNGTNGLNGVDGVNGTNGLAGINGTNGLNGVNGTNGLNGNLVSSFIYAYDAGTASVANNGKIVLASYGANTGGGDSWSTNGSAFTIPTTGVYQIQFALNGARSTHTFALDITDSPNSLVQAGVDPGYFQFNSTGNTATATLSGQILVNCSAGDVISLKNVGGFTITYGNGVPTSAPSATLIIQQIH